MESVLGRQPLELGRSGRLETKDKEKIQKEGQREMRRNEVMALVFCLVGSCPMLLPSRSLATILCSSGTESSTAVLYV